jgi:hypothetical protein
VATSPNPDPEFNLLADVAASSPTDVWAVGSQGGIPRRTLVERWDGTAWSVIPSPNVPTATTSLLNSVAVLSATDVWAAGYGNDPDPGDWTLTMHWDGIAWSVIPSPNISITTSNRLHAVAAVTPNDVWAVGYYVADFGGGGYARTLIEHWDGTTWRVVPSPNVGSDNNELNDIVAVSANDIWAVGEYWGGGGVLYQTLILHWDGRQWSVISSPNPGTGLMLWGVAAVAADDVWAAGRYVVGYDERTLILHWDGITWSQVPSPSPGAASYLFDVVATSATDAWAVGYYIDPNTGGEITLTLHWDGQTWTHIPSPSPSPVLITFLGVTALAPDDVWAVGDVWTGSGNAWQTLIEHYAPVCATPTPTRTPASFTPTPTTTPTATTCVIAFTDVDPTNPFYHFIRCLACRGIVSGYSDGTFRWGNDVTRGQLAKILAGAANFQTPIPTTQQTFTDVPFTNPFWLWIERVVGVGAISGYACGGPGEPCDPQQRPYFRWGRLATRGQLAKITALTAQIPDPIPTTQQTFTDVPPGNPFWPWIEQLAGRNVINGYACGGPGEPCDPLNRPYFRWGNPATRGQMTKIATQTFSPSCASSTVP